MKDHLETSIFGDHEDTLEHHDPHADPHTDPHADPHGDPHAPVLLSRRELRERELAARKRGGRGDRRGRDLGGPSTGRAKPSILRRILVIALALAVIGGGVAVAYTALRPVVEGLLESNDYPGPGTGEVRVTVEQGAGGTAIAKVLAEEDVVKTSKAFIEAANEDARSAGIQPGVYEMKKQMKASDALAILVDPKNRIITRVVIPEGLWASEIFGRLSKASGIPVAQYAAAAKKVDDLGLPASAKGNIEGYLFPASYEFGPTSTALDQLKQMVAESTKRLDALGISPAQMERVDTVLSCP